MEDREFLALDPPAAQAALVEVADVAERERLKQLYARTRGFLVDGTGWNPKSPAARAVGWMQGRMNRAQYWTCLLALIAIYGVFWLLPHSRPPSVSEVLLILICVPRLHDMGRTGWFAAGVFAFEIAAAIAALTLTSPDTALEVMGGVVILIAGLLVVLGLWPGQAGANRFGPPPRAGLDFRRRDPAAEAATNFE